MQLNNTSPEYNSRMYGGNVQPEGFPALPDGWASEWEIFPSNDNSTKLFGVVHQREPRSGNRVLFVIHGLGEHGGRYLHVPHYVKDAVDAVYCLDLRGHGRSEGIKGHCEKFEDYVDDVAHAIGRILDKWKSHAGGAEVHILGHSFGGLITLRLLLSHSLPLASVTVSAPLLGLKVKVPSVKRFAAAGLSRIWGSLQMDSGLSPDLISHDPEVQKAYKRDKLVHSKITPKCFFEMLEAIDDTCKRRGEQIRTPIQFLTPGDDQIVDQEPAIKFYEAISHPDKMIRKYPGFYHESLNEIHKEQPFGDLLAWIKAHHTTNSV